MKFIDMHCDTLMPYVKDEPYSLFKNDKQVDFLKMQEGRALAQFFAVFFPPVEGYERMGIPAMSDDEYFARLTNGLFSEIEKHKDIIALAKTYDDIITNEKNGLMNAVLTIEDARFIQGDMNKIKWAYDKGVRAFGLTWNFENCFGFPNSDPESMNKGLTDFGIDAISVLNDLGIMIDVSHLSDGGFYDVIKHSKKPFIASHSNARSITNHTRNLTDDMLKALANKGGVTGLNLCPAFMAPSTDATHTSMQDILRHAKHIKNVAGIDTLAIGTDFDGIYGTQEIPTSKEIPLLYDALKKEGFTESEIEKVASKNVLRVMKEVLK